MADDPNPKPDPEPNPDPEPDKGGDDPDEVEAFQPITSQEDFDRAIKARLRREREKTADYADLKAKASELDELKKEQQTEAEREKAAREAAEKRAEAAETKARVSLVRSAVVAEAAKQNAVDPEAVFRLIDSEDLEFDDEGAPKNVAEVVKGLLAERDYLVGKPTGGRGNADQGARGGADGQIARDALKDMSPEAIRDALKEGKLDSTLASGG